jgi:hypothetical protein
MRRALLCLAFLLGSGSVTEAQEPELDRVLQLFTTYWGQGEAHRVLSLVAQAGVSIEIDGGSFGPLGSRQAAAVLRRVLDDRETITLRRGMVRMTGRSPPRAFGEITWQSRARGTTIPESVTIFVAFTREDAGWRITEIRLRPP